MSNTEKRMSDEDTTDFLRAVLLDSPTTKSDSARFFADELAELASRGLITTYIRGIGYSNRWVLTLEGMKFLQHGGKR